MNNVKYWNDSLAHDFDMFMPKEKKAVDNVVVIPETKTKVAPKKKTIKSKAFIALTVTFIVLTFFCNIFLHAEISRLSSQISLAEAKSEELKSERTRLNVEYERKSSVGNLEKAAQGLGMQKQSKNQTNYIFNYLDEDNTLQAENE